MLEQAESPTFSYLMGGTESKSYPTAINYKLLGAGPLPENLTTAQCEHLLQLGMEKLYMGKEGTVPGKGVLRPTADETFHWSGCTPSFAITAWNCGAIGCQYFIGGHFKIPHMFADVPHSAVNNPQERCYFEHQNHTMRAILECNKHASAGCEAYGFEEDGDVWRCMQARGFVSAWHQPTRVVTDSQGVKVTVTCPPLAAVPKSASPEYCRSKDLDPSWAGKVIVEDYKFLVH